MPSCTKSSIIAAFSKVFAILRACDYQPARNVMDNKCFKAVEKHIRANKMNIQLSHRTTTASTPRNVPSPHLKNTFLPPLQLLTCSAPYSFADKLLPQVELTLNLSRFSHRNPRVLANQELYGPFDFNKMPLAPLGTKALVYDDPATRAFWAPHATDGFYVGPANNHYHCLCFYIPSTCCFRFANLWWLYPAHCQVPVASEQDKTLLAAADLFKQLGHTIPTIASTKLKHLSAICQLSAIMSGQINLPPPIPTSPRVEIDPSPRVAIATPPRVATT
jgi:hypothetical protein